MSTSKRPTGTRKRAAEGILARSDDPLWYKDAVIYELHVRAFADGNGDGIGDFRGLADRLDYLRDLGITAVWLLPFYPSPLRDDGYDIADYTKVHPDYGTLRDFKRFLREAHRRGIRVITELVLNHTSDQHPWFRRARRAPAGSVARDFYVWSDTPDRFAEARIIFKDFESSNWSWDPVAKAYYWHRFYGHQPDLNYDSPAVRRAIIRVIDFWLGMGVDGLRYDAVPYLYEREGTSCENLRESHDMLRKLRVHVDERYTNRMFLAEANQWPEDAAEYFGDGDECHMAFHFPVMPRMFMALRMEDRYPIIDILEQTPEIPETCQWAVFLRNHDELTLEMVTDEERDYMYRVYAHDPRARINLGIRRRLAPLLGNDRRRIELMNGLLLSLPGTPVIYYGDEITMGDNIYLGDRDGVRTPMQWSGDRNAGFSRANAQKLFLPVIIDPEFHYEAVNIEAQQNNPHSMLWWMRRLIALRKRFQAFGRGSIRFLYPQNRKVLAFLRIHGEETILVVANLSRFVQFVELDLEAYEGVVPIELFGRTRFPRIGELPYLLTLGPHAFYWFQLKGAPQRGTAVEEKTSPEPAALQVSAGWDSIFRSRAFEALADRLPDHLMEQRWFGGKARTIKGVDLIDAVPVGGAGAAAFLVLIRVSYVEGEPSQHCLPVTYADGSELDRWGGEHGPPILTRIRSREGAGALYDGTWNEGFCASLLESIRKRRRLKGSSGDVAAAAFRGLRRVLPNGEPAPDPRRMRAEQSNSSIVFGDRLILKIFRSVEPGTNPELEIGRFLTERSGSRLTPACVGSLEYQGRGGASTTIGVLQEFVPNGGDAWRLTLDHLGQFYDRVSAAEPATRAAVPEPPRWEYCTGEAIPEHVEDRIGGYLETAHQLGARTGELHRVLASENDDPAFAPEPFTPFYQRSLLQSLRNNARSALQLLRSSLGGVAEEQRGRAEAVLDLERRIVGRYHEVLKRKLETTRIRVHGDFHLGQILYTGTDFLILDFEGEPVHSLAARRMKRSPLRDVAGMLRSFDYAASTALVEQGKRGAIGELDVPVMEEWGRAWTQWASAAFLSAYLDEVEPCRLLPGSDTAMRALLEIYLLEKALYELAYELNNRPAWVGIPLRGILELMEERE
ncbi:MAG: maltose alpha-D-glucosyltransferase [Candidatus Eisenbacteria bacterium]|nr:maltose alpha-D-glucosyltransferase [Candidatus Latescibacterota bacterium]MBD3301325.1 maltose alpha-D-glucosyltransferase [Candidatus Eisenbacteria bacterium]